MILTLLFIINLWIKLTCSHMEIFQSAPYLSYITCNNTDRHYRDQVCVSTDVRAAIVWTTFVSDDNNQDLPKNDINEPLSCNTLIRPKKINTEYSSYYKNYNDMCNIENDLCFSKWRQVNKNWKITNSYDVPMGPVFDNRWENFYEDTITDNTYHSVNKSINGVRAAHTFDRVGSLVFSVKPSEDSVRFILCNSKYYSINLCYLIILNTYVNESSVHICPDGMGLQDTMETPLTCIHRNISIVYRNLEKVILDTKMWNTFVLEWDALAKTIKLFDTTELIFVYNEVDSNITFHERMLSYHIFYTAGRFRTLFRIHEYSYVLTTQPGSKFISPTFIANKGHNNKVFCIDILVGLCKKCLLVISVLDEMGEKRLIKTVGRAAKYESMWYDIYMWQYERILLRDDNTGFTKSVTLQLTTLLQNLNDTDAHWAIGGIDECLPIGSVKKIRTSIYQSSSNNTWPISSCQEMSYDKLNSEIMTFQPPVIPSLPHQMICGNHNFGPFCATECSSHFAYDCHAVTMCNADMCFCAQGNQGSQCNETCPPGKYGYGCTRKCVNCYNETCNSYSGGCLNGCKEFPDRRYIPPFCEFAVVIPPAPGYEIINATTVRVFLRDVNNYQRIDGFVSFVIQSNGIIREILDINKNVNYVIFHELLPELTYSVRTVLNIKLLFKNKFTKVEGRPATFTLPSFVLAAPKITETKQIGHGIIHLKWIAPHTINNVSIKTFWIDQLTLITYLHNSRIKINESIILQYQVPNITYSRIDDDHREYQIYLHLAPSTIYKISVHSMGGKDVRFVETDPSVGFQYDPYPVLLKCQNNECELKCVIPTIINNTLDSSLHIMVKGQSSESRHNQIKTEILAKGVVANNFNADWIAATITGNYIIDQSFTIGDKNTYNNIWNCPLYRGHEYIITIIITGINRNKSQESKVLWKSPTIYIAAIYSQIPRELWITSLVIIFIIVCTAAYFWFKRSRTKRKLRQKRAIKNFELTSIRRNCGRRFTKKEESYVYPNINHSAVDPIYEEIIQQSLIKVNHFPEYVKFAIADGKLDEEYAAILPKQQKSCEYEKLHQNRRKNLKSNFIVYDDTRVVLEKLSGDFFSDYINANYIKSHRQDKAYIAAQGPQSNTLNDFWRMIWQENIQVICMLTNVHEKKKKKCEKYWTEIGKEIKFGQITVTTINKVVCVDYTLRNLRVTCKEESRKIKHLHYTTWPDHGVPSYTQAAATYLKKLRTAATNNSPILVHGSTGIGRTGSIILCDICIRRAAADNVIDVFSEMDMLRNQRGNMVESKEQYLFVHLVLVEYFSALATTITCDEQLSTKINEHKNQLMQLQQKLNESVWQDLALQPAVMSTCKISDKCRAKNRFPDHLQPSSRLCFARYSHTDHETNYIGGVYVDSAKRKNNYIASSFPLPNAVSDFWKMVVEFKVELIILLEPINYQDKTCGKFIPEPGEELKPIPCLLLSSKIIKDTHVSCQQKINIINNLQEPAYQTSINILTCKCWESGKDKPPPSPTVLIDLWQTVEKLPKSEAPIIVLCYDGVTNCCLYLAMSYLLEKMGLERECNICYAIRAIRRSRPDFYKNIDQMKYLYDAAATYSTYFDFTYVNFL